MRGRSNARRRANTARFRINPFLSEPRKLPGNARNIVACPSASIENRLVFFVKYSIRRNWHSNCSGRKMKLFKKFFADNRAVWCTIRPFEQAHSQFENARKRPFRKRMSAAPIGCQPFLVKERLKENHGKNYLYTSRRCIFTCRDHRVFQSRSSRHAPDYGAQPCAHHLRTDCSILWPRWLAKRSARLRSSLRSYLPSAWRMRFHPGRFGQRPYAEHHPEPANARHARSRRTHSARRTLSNRRAGNPVRCRSGLRRTRKQGQRSSRQEKRAILSFLPTAPLPLHPFISESDARSASSNSAGRAESVLEIFLIEDIVRSAKENKHHTLCQSSLITQESIGLRVAFEGQDRRTERKVVLKDGRDVCSRAVQIEVEEKGSITLIEREVEEMLWYNELSLQACARNEARGVCVSVGRAQISSPKRRCFHVALNAARQPARTIEVTSICS